MTDRTYPEARQRLHTRSASARGDCRSRPGSPACARRSSSFLYVLPNQGFYEYLGIPLGVATSRSTPRATTWPTVLFHCAWTHPAGARPQRRGRLRRPARPRLLRLLRGRRLHGRAADLAGEQAHHRVQLAGEPVAVAGGGADRDRAGAAVRGAAGLADAAVAR